MSNFSSALGILSAMITPAVLIMATSSLILATSQRLGRVVDRARKLSEQFEALAHASPLIEHGEERRRLVFQLLDKATRRVRLIQRAMVRLYLALSLFIATSIAIGIVTAIGQEYRWVLVTLGMLGVALLFNAAILLIAESRLALLALDREMDFVRQLGESHAPLYAPLSQREQRRPLFGWRSARR